MGLREHFNITPEQWWEMEYWQSEAILNAMPAYFGDNTTPPKRERDTSNAVDGTTASPAQLRAMGIKVL